VNAQQQFHYEEPKDQYLCPAGEVMKKESAYTRATKTGYEQSITVYQTAKCAACPLQSKCNPGGKQRTLHINHNKDRLALQAEQRLKTKRGIEKRKQRCWDTEPVFAGIKHNHGFKRFLLRGIKKVNVEMGLLALAHNLRKKAA
jgi:hypothetical protein